MQEISYFSTLHAKQKFIIARLLRLGAETCVSHKCPCGAQVCSLGLHGHVCRRSRGRLSRHAAANDVIARALSSGGGCPQSRSRQGAPVWMATAQMAWPWCLGSAGGPLSGTSHARTLSHPPTSHQRRHTVDQQLKRPRRRSMGSWRVPTYLPPSLWRRLESGQKSRLRSWRILAGGLRRPRERGAQRVSSCSAWASRSNWGTWLQYWGHYLQERS